MAFAVALRWATSSSLFSKLIRPASVSRFFNANAHGSNVDDRSVDVEQRSSALSVSEPRRREASPSFFADINSKSSETIQHFKGLPHTFLPVELARSSSQQTSQVFEVRRKEPELVAPAKPTPRESKPLSDIDDQHTFRKQPPCIHFYRHNPSMQGKDPVKIIREAIAQTLVFYYPFAGRLREGPNRKLSVDCTGEGVLFIEADADVTLDQFGHPVLPPFPCLDELLYNVPGSAGMLNCPLLLIQVTRLKCKGFILALRFNHTMSDGAGLAQFMAAVGEMACGATTPSVTPIWQRNLFCARDPPRITCVHHEYDDALNDVSDTQNNHPLNDVLYRHIYFGSTEISALRETIPSHLRSCTRFEIITACIWRCLTIALKDDPADEVRLLFAVNARNKLNPELMKGYYGNVLATVAARARAGSLCRNPLEYALELVRKAKEEVTEEYIRSMADLLVIRGRPRYTREMFIGVSDLRHAGFSEADFGWGNAVYGGPAMACGEINSKPILFYLPFRNEKGDNETVVPICLPPKAMQRFVKELDRMLHDN